MSVKTPPSAELAITVFAAKGGIQFEIYAYRPLTDDEINSAIARYIVSRPKLFLDKKNKIYTVIGKDDPPLRSNS